MTINTKQVTDRRDVRYQSLQEVIDDAQRLATPTTQRLGNWSPGQIYEHLARTITSSIDGFGMSFPAPLRWLMTLFMKRRFLTKGLPAGFKSPAKFVAEQTPDTDGLQALQHAIARFENESTRAPHPGFGELTNQEWIQFHLRHAELHMSFINDSKAAEA